MALFPVGLSKILRVYNNKIIPQMSIAPCNPKCFAVGYKLSAHGQGEQRKESAASLGSMQRTGGGEMLPGALEFALYQAKRQGCWI